MSPPPPCWKESDFMKLSGREHVARTPVPALTQGGRLRLLLLPAQTRAPLPLNSVSGTRCFTKPFLPAWAGYNGRRARKGWGRWVQTVWYYWREISWKIGRTKQMTLFQPGYLKSAECSQEDGVWYPIVLIFKFTDCIWFGSKNLRKQFSWFLFVQGPLFCGNPIAK